MPSDRLRYRVSSWLFARGLGVVCLLAFASLGAQAQGLFGSRGVMPIAMFVASAKRAGHGFWDHPSMLWWWNGDAAITTVWIVGIGASISLVVGLLPKLALALSWFAYLSFVSLGWPFMSFQWDTLLLEACFTSFFFVPWCIWDRLDSHSEPNPVARWAIWWLLFRLVFRSAFVKLASGDATWADLSALSYHYWTQPLPNVVGWYANLLPLWFQKLSCLSMFALELGAPVLVWIPRAWARRAAGVALIALMLLIALTGNYGFFNLLTIVLCISLFDDRSFQRILRRPVERRSAAPVATKWSTWPSVAPAIVILVSAAVFFTGTFGARPPGWLNPIYRFSTFNNYGLFAVMTTERPEVEIEGTVDGETWLAYEFPYKLGPLDRPPPWVAPHMPRLDWQMWFAALGDYRRNPWLANLMRRLLEGEPEVLGLLGSNPFGEEPPRQVRALIYRYEPTSFDEKTETGDWWKRRDRTLYAPILGVPIDSTSTEE